MAHIALTGLIQLADRNTWGSRPRLFYAAPSGLQRSEFKMSCIKDVLKTHPQCADSGRKHEKTEHLR